MSSLSSYPRVNNQDRLKALFETQLLDTPPERGFDRFTNLARKLLNAPIALVSLVDKDRQFFKSQVGLPSELAAKRQTPLSHSFCKHVVESGRELLIEDAPNHQLVCENPVIPELSLRAYAGVPLTSEDGQILGSFCVIDTRVREWSGDEVDILRELAGAVETEIRLRTELRGHLKTKSLLAQTLQLQQQDEGKAALVEVLRTLIRNTPQAIAMFDRDMVYVAHSLRWVTDYGLDQVDLIGLCHYEVFPDIPKRFKEEHQRALAGEIIIRANDEFERADGKVEHVFREIRPWRNPSGKIGGILLLTDVLTEEHEMNSELQHSLERMRDAETDLQETVKALITTQRMAKVERWTWDLVQNRLYRHSLGDGALKLGQDDQFLSSRVRGLPMDEFLDLVVLEDRERLRSKLNKCARTPAPFSEQFTLHISGDVPVHYHLEAVPTVDLEGRLTHYVGSLQDITKQRQLEIQLFETQKVEAIGKMAAGIAHDFNNVLNVIQGFAMLIRGNLPSDSSVHPDLSQLLLGAQQGQRLVQQLLAFSRKQPLEKQILDLNSVIRENLELLHLLVKSRVSIKLELDDDLPPISINRSKLEQLLFNLVGNAADAITGQGTVSIQSTIKKVGEKQVLADGNSLVPGTYFRLSVADTGSGIGEERHHIFEPLFTTKEEGKGTGLGLSVCSGLASRAGGGIDLESELGEGSTFHVYLPFTEALLED